MDPARQPEVPSSPLDAGPAAPAAPAAPSAPATPSAPAVPAAPDLTSPGRHDLATSAPMTGRPRDYWRVARTPRMLALLLLVLALAAVFVRLGAWQLDRAALRGAAAEEEAFAAVLATDPVPLAEALRAQTPFTAAQLGVPVEVTGAFRPDQQVLVPGREVGGRPATLVVTALEVGAGPDAGAMLPVVRGWLPGEAVDAAGAPRDAETAARLRVPPGERRVTGYLGPSEAAVGGDRPPGTVGAVSSAELANLWGGPTFSGYLVEFTEGPGGRAVTGPTGLDHAPPPGMAQETGLNLQNLAYAAEWVIFGGFAVFIFWRVLRDEVTRRREEAPR